MDNFVLWAALSVDGCLLQIPGGTSISHDTPNECFVEGQFNVSA
jgi:hypothetical protein